MAEPATTPSHSAEPMAHPVHAHPDYWRVYAWLVALLVVSVAGPMLEIRVLTLLTAFGVAVYKAYLVAKNFMHINVERPFIPYLILTVLAFMLLLFAGSAPDVMKPEGHRWVKPAWVAAPGEPSGHGAEGAVPHD